MNKTRIIVAGLCLLALSMTAWGQNRSVPGIPGYLDARTGTFRPMAQTIESEDLGPVNPTTGKVVITLTVTLQSTFPTGEVYSCGANLTTFDTSSGLSFLETDLITATKSGNTLTCTITVPYSWALVSPSTDMMMVGYTVNATNGTSALPLRTADHGVANIRVPPNGTTTTYTLATLI